MFPSVAKLVRRISDRSRQDAREHGQRRRQGVRLAVERLEERTLMAAAPFDGNDQTAEAMYGGTIRSTTTVTQTGTIDNGFDVDLWEINLPTISAGGEYVDFDIDRTSGNLDSYLRIFDSSGREVASNDDAAAPGERAGITSSYLRHKFTSSGRYYVGVSAYGNTGYGAVTGMLDSQGSTTGGFRLTIRGLGPDVDDQIGEALLTADKSGNVQGTDVDMYRFQAQAGERVEILTLRGTSPDIRLRVFDASGREIRKTGMVYEFWTAGTYYLGVSRSLNSSYNPVTGTGDRAGPTFGGNYRVYIREVQGPIMYNYLQGSLFMTGSNNNVPSSFDWDKQHGTLTGDQVQMYRLEVPETNPVPGRDPHRSFSLYAVDTAVGGLASPNLVVRLFNANGQEIAVNPSQPRYIGYRTLDLDYLHLDPGVYYVGVSLAGNRYYDPMTGEGLLSVSRTVSYELHANRG